MRRHRAMADEELIRDLAVRQPLRNKTQDFDLARGNAGRPGSADSRRQRLNLPNARRRAQSGEYRAGSSKILMCGDCIA